MSTETPVPKRTGRPSYEPTDLHRGEVRAAVRLGEPQTSIAASLGLSLKTLRKHYRDELDYGKVRFLRRVSNSLGEQALGRPAVFDPDKNMIREELKPNVGAAIFILKTQAKQYGWVERNELTGADGSTLFVEIAGGLPLMQSEPPETAEQPKPPA